MIYFDTETCGFHGPIVLLQYAEDDGNVVLHNPWIEPITDTLAIIEWMCSHRGGVCGFNLVYDWFHLCQLYTTLLLLRSRTSGSAIPEEYIELYAELEPLGRDGPCLKPVTAMDLMLFARKGPYQSTMDRKSVRIKRVPKQLAKVLVGELERRIPLPKILFAKAKDKTRWKIYPCRDHKTGKEHPDLVDVSMTFRPSSALKALVIDAGIREADKRLLFHDVMPERTPLEVGWAPFALALSNKKKGWHCKIGKKKGYAWPRIIPEHIIHWEYDKYAREYAKDDVLDTRNLHYHFGSPEPGDDDSILACMMGAIRWRGYTIDIPNMTVMRNRENVKAVAAPKAPHHVHHYLSQVMTETELVAIEESTKKVVLEGIIEWKKDCDCGTVEKIEYTEEGLFGPTVKTKTTRHPDKDCMVCNGSGKTTHPAALRAKECLDARKAANKVTLFNKLLQAGKLHPAASIIGSLSGRMSGRTEVGQGKRSAGLNALGIQSDKTIRKLFPLAEGDLVLTGGDFAGFEVAIADAKYNDPVLREQLLTCVHCKKVSNPDDYRADTCPHCGKTNEPFQKMHGLFAMALYPGNTYDDIIATKGLEKDLYSDGKRGFFSQVYGGDENTLNDRIGIPVEEGKAAKERFFGRYKGVEKAQRGIFDKFCSMRQPGGIGKRVEWHEPSEYVESLNGFRRYFTLENTVCKALFVLAENPPKAWQALKIRVVRRDREQLIANAVRSALFAAAFQIQAQSMRAAINHEIQSTGAIITKQLQCLIWTLQPSGIQPWKVQPFNVHDEIMCPALLELHDVIEVIVNDFINAIKELIPLIKIDWSSKLKSWAEK
jgi:hypothetical protein